jgi:hypothetical protein
VDEPVAKKLSDVANPISSRQRVCVEKEVIQVEVQVAAMASDCCLAKASLFEPTPEITEKSSILLAELLTTTVVIRFIVEHEKSLSGTGHADAGRIGPAIPSMLPASMARWNRGEA